MKPLGTALWPLAQSWLSWCKVCWSGFFLVPMGFQPAIAREKLTWATRANSASRGKSAGGCPGADWKRLARNGAEGASLSRLAEPGAQQK